MLHTSMFIKMYVERIGFLFKVAKLSLCVKIVPNLTLGGSSVRLWFHVSFAMASFCDANCIVQISRF